MSTSVADEIAAVPAAAGCRRMYARTEQALSPVPEALQQREELRCIGMQSDEGAAFAAAGEAQLTGQLTLCCGSGGWGNWQMCGGLYEAHYSASPLVALAPHVPASTMGSRYFQESRPEWGLRDCTSYCEMAYEPGQAVRSVAEAIRVACSQRTTAAVVLPSDVMNCPASCETEFPYFPSMSARATAEPSMSEVARLAELLNRSRKVVFLCGRGCEGAHDILTELAQRLCAPIAYTLRGKDIMEKDNPCAVGMIGLLGWGDAPAAVQVADLLVLWGTDFPYGCFLPEHGQVVQVDIDGAAPGRRVRLCHAVQGDVARTASLLLPLLRGHRSDEFLARSLMRHGKALVALERSLREQDERAPIRPEYLTRILSSHAEPDAVFTIDIGPPVIWAARYLQAFGKRRLIGSFKYGATGCALAMAIGCKAASPSRQVIALCAAESFNRQLGELLTLAREGLSVKVVVYNVSSPHVVNMPGSASSSVVADLTMVARGLGIEAERAEQVGGVMAAVRRCLAAQGPFLLDVQLDRHALAQPPGSDLLRTILHLSDKESCNSRCELDTVKRLLFGNSHFYS